MKSVSTIILCTLCACFLFSACTEKADDINAKNHSTLPAYTTALPEATNPSDFTAYEGCNGISNIEEVFLPDSFSNICRSYKFLYRSDDFNIQAYISIPDDCTEISPSKCILYNRGGNSKLGLLTDTDTANICAATGRIVVASQYRGSVGSEGVDEFGGRDLQDIFGLIDLCEQTFSFTDMTDFCAVGVSRGGMMTYMAAKADPRIKRIIAISAVSDLVSAYNDREDMKALLTNAIGGTPEELPEEYENRSAVCWASEITVPTLIIHSKGDSQVSFSQAETLAKILTAQGTEVSFVTRDDSTHGISKDDMSIILKWLSEN